MTTRSIHVPAGNGFVGTLLGAIKMATRIADPVRFTFGDVTITVSSDSDPELIERDYRRASRGYIGKAIGPYPNPVLSDKERENDARIEKEKKRQYQRWLAGEISESELS